MISRFAGVALVVTAALMPGRAEAQAPEALSGLEEAMPPLGPPTVQAGAGMMNFTERGTKTVTDPGVMWTVRGLLPIGRHFGAEIAYLGSARPAELANAGDASVLHNGVELVGRAGRRFSFGPMAYLSPYVFAGVGGGVYSVVGEAGEVPGLRDDDAVFTIPLGVGVATGYGRYGVDLRFSYRPAFGDEMFTDVYDGSFTDGLNSLGLSAALGYSF